MDSVESLARSLDILINAKANEKIRLAESVAIKHSSLLHEIKGIARDAQTRYDAAKANGLTANTLEAEGYLRCALEILDFINSSN